MMAAISLLVLLLTRGGVQTESHGSDASAELKELRDMVVAMTQRLAAQETELAAVKTRLAATETEVVNLEKEIKAAPKVAFSAGLAEPKPTFRQATSNDLNAVFRRVVTNVGEAYNSTTGFFTAPVRGVFYFRFTVMDKLTSRYMRIRMHKNGEILMRLEEHDRDMEASYLSSGLTLQLEKGDTVNLVLPANHRLYDDTNNHNSFSGFMLFPL